MTNDRPDRSGASEGNSSFVTRHSSFIVPSRNSLGLVAVLVAMWYAGVAQSNGAAHLLGFLLAALAAVSAVHAWMNLRGLRVRAGKIAPVFAGERLTVPLAVTAAPRSTPRALRLDAGDTTHAVAIDAATAECEVSAVLSMATERRGCFTRLRITAASAYPLGFFTARRRFVVEQEFCVYPRPAGTAPMPHATVASQERREGTRIEGDDFAGVRPWVQGESQRHIDWKAAARSDSLLTKQWAGDGGETVHFDWRDTPPGDVETRLSQLAQWIVTSDRAGFRYALTLPGTMVAADRGDAHRHACLHALASFSPEEIAA